MLGHAAQPPTIYLIAGCSGAGKTTFAREFVLKECGFKNSLPSGGSRFNLPSCR